MPKLPVGPPLTDVPLDQPPPVLLAVPQVLPLGWAFDAGRETTGHFIDDIVEEGWGPDLVGEQVRGAGEGLRDHVKVAELSCAGANWVAANPRRR